MSHTSETALILAQQEELARLRATQCEHCRDYFPVFRDDAIFVGKRQFTRDGLFSAFRPDESWTTTIDSLVFSLQADFERSCIGLYVGFPQLHPADLAPMSIFADPAIMTQDSVEYFCRDISGVLCMPSLRLCSHARERWKRIFREVRAKYNSNT